MFSTAGRQMDDCQNHPLTPTLSPAKAGEREK